MTNPTPGRPRVPGQAPAQATQLQVQARQGQHLAAIPGQSQEIADLINGLSTFNSALKQYGTVEADIQQQQMEEQRRQAKPDGAGWAQGVENPREALSGAPIPGLDNKPPAYTAAFRDAAQEALAQRAAIDNKARTITAYGEQKDSPDFNPDAFLQEHRTAALQGITDPRAQAIIGSHFSELEGEIKLLQGRERQTRQDEIRASTMTKLLGDLYTPNMAPEGFDLANQVMLARAKELGYTPKEAAQYAFFQVAHISSKAGGAPEVFAAFDQKGPDGLSLLDHNPQLAAHVDAARHQASQMRDKAILDASEKDNARTLMGYQSDIDTAPEKVTMDRILRDMTKYGAVQSPGQASSLWAAAQDALRKKQATGLAMADAQGGRLWIYDPKVQGQVLDQMAGPLVKGLADATSAGKPEEVAAIGAQLLQLHSRTGATVPVDQLQRYTKTLVTNLQNPEGASPQFQAAAALYRSMSGNPQYRDLYFDEKTSNILDTFNRSTAGGSDAKSAYQAAYQNSSPEAANFKMTPEYQKLVDGDVKKYVEGSSWWPRWLGGNGRPNDNGALNQATVSEVKRFRGQFPWATEDQLEGHLQGWAQKNFVLDTTSNTPVKVPPGLSGPAAQEALSAYSKAKTDSLNLGTRSDAKWSVQYMPQGTEGVYTAVAFNGSATQSLGTVNLQDLMSTERAQKVLTPEEQAQLGAARRSIQRGEMPFLDPALMAKAEATKAFSSDEMAALKEGSQRQFIERLRTQPTFTFGKPSFDNLQFIPGKEGKIDNQLTAKVASEFLGTGPLLGGAVGAGSSHLARAAALTTMGEGVMLNTYDDPAKGAGKNIGMGYNLDANKATVDADLKASGVDPSLIEAVKDGRASLTPDQAKRLLLVALPRYEKQVQEVANGTSPGLWDRMTVSQRAAMIDVAYQVGSTDKFKKAWAALSKGDEATFREEAKVTYVDRNGVRKEDTRRNNLRAAMLAGQSVWDQTVQKFGSLPSTKLQALSMNQ